MGEFLFSGAFLLVSLTTFLQGFHWAGWNRGYIGVYGAVVETCVCNFASDRMEVEPYFNQAMLEEKLKQYVAYNMKPYSRSTTYEIRLSDRNEDRYGCSTLQIDFHGDLGWRTIDKTALFHIEKIQEDQA